MEDVKNVEKCLRLVIPGDEVVDVQEVEEGINVILGPGLTREGSQVICNRCGVLRSKVNAKIAMFWVDCHSKRSIRGFYRSLDESVKVLFVLKLSFSFGETDWPNPNVD